MKRRLLLLLFSMLSYYCFSAKSLTLKDIKCDFRYDYANNGLIKPTFSWKLVSDQRNVMQTAYQIKVATDPKLLKSGKNLVWNSGKTQSEQSAYLSYLGIFLKSRQSYYWQVTVWDNKGNSFKSSVQQWTCGLVESDWKASWIERGGKDKEEQVVIFRKAFEIDKTVQSAKLYITSHGIYNAEINGKTVGDQLMTPGWTAYQKRLQYQIYDVSEILKTGSNAIAVSVAEGWFKGPLLAVQHVYGDKVALLSQLEIVYKDGTKQTVLTDQSWKTSINGPVVRSGIYSGETYDARKKDNFSNAEFSEDKDWNPVILVEKQSYKELIASIAHPVTRHEVIKPQQIIVSPKGETIIDFGQNMIGHIRFSINGTRGDSVMFSHAEVLDKDGNFYTRNLRTAKQHIVYHLVGDGLESYEPFFTFQGFRYVRVEGKKELINLDNIEAVVVHTYMPQTGKFETSNSLLNQLQHNILWGQKSNFLDIPTDCPQRDERLGWTGDAQVFFNTATFNMDVSSFFVKWLTDLRAEQLENGGVPGVVPNVWGTGERNIGQAGWADAATIIPWQWYKVYSDKQMLEDSYPSMLKWAEYIASRCTDHLWDKSWHHGDWLHYMPNNVWDNAPAYTDKTLIAQAFYAYTLQNIIHSARVLDKKNDVEKYSKLLKVVKDKFLSEFVTPAGAIMSNTQTAYVLALQFDILPENSRAKAAKRLVKLVEEYGNHISTGFLGTPHICHVLSRFGYQDIAYKLLFQESFPSWLYPVKKGATTIWERWDGIKPDGSFQDEAMNSFNHYAYGAIGDWMYKNIGGINQSSESSGYKNIIISPKPGGNITNSNIEFESVYGKISCTWLIEGKKMTLNVEIPANTRAEIVFPEIRTGDILESGKNIGMGPDSNSYKTGSGKYSFIYKIK